MSSKFDFVIVGGGTAGLVLAARLSEDATVQVLVIEAGENLSDDPRVKIPAMWPQLQGTECDWQFRSVPQVSHRRPPQPCVKRANHIPDRMP